MSAIHAKMGATTEFEPSAAQQLTAPGLVEGEEQQEPERKRLKKIDFRYTTYVKDHVCIFTRCVCRLRLMCVRYQLRVYFKQSDERSGGVCQRAIPRPPRNLLDALDAIVALTTRVLKLVLRQPIRLIHSSSWALSCYLHFVH